MPSNVVLFLNVKGTKLASLNSILQDELCKNPRFGPMLESLSSLVNGDEILSRVSLALVITINVHRCVNSLYFTTLYKCLLV